MIKLAKKLDRVLLWEGTAVEGETKYFNAVDLSRFHSLIIKGGDTELIEIPIVGVGQYNGSITTYAANTMYIKSLMISITSDHFYIEYAKQKLVGNNSSGAIQTFKIYKLFGVY